MRLAARLSGIPQRLLRASALLCWHADCARDILKGNGFIRSAVRLQDRSKGKRSRSSAVFSHTQTQEVTKTGPEDLCLGLKKKAVRIHRYTALAVT